MFWRFFQKWTCDICYELVWYPRLRHHELEH